MPWHAERAFTWDDLRRAPVAQLRRFTELGHVTRALACPIIGEAGGALGAIELVDPLSGVSFRSMEVVATRWVAQRLAQLVARRGLVTDVGAIARFAAHSWLR